MIKTVAQTDGSEFLFALSAHPRCRELERNRNILQRGHGRNEMEGLENDSHVPSAKTCQRVLIECAQVFARDRDGSAIRALKARHHHE